MLGQTKARYNFWAMSFKFQLEDSKDKKKMKRMVKLKLALNMVLSIVDCDVHVKRIFYNFSGNFVPFYGWEWFKEVVLLSGNFLKLVIHNQVVFPYFFFPVK
jgi:hypothetical protein